MNYIRSLLAYLQPYLTKVVGARSAQLFLVQLAAAFAVLFAISFWSVPVALIVGGVFAIYAIQTQAGDNDEDAALANKTRTLIATLESGQKLGKGDSVAASAVIEHLTEDSK